MTLADVDLERLLTLAAGDYPVPDDGIERILAAEGARPPRRRRPLAAFTWRPQRGLVVVGATVAVVAAFGVGVVALGGHGPSTPSTASSAGTSPADGLSTSEGIRTGPESGPAFNGQGGTLAGGKSIATNDQVAEPAAASPPPHAAAVPVPSAANQELVRTGHADLTVGKGGVPAAQAQLENLATSDGGIVAKEQSTSGASPSAQLTLRVPGDQYANLVAAVRKVGTVVDLQTQAADVTSQYTDLAARIKALQQTRDTYLTMLSRATTIGDTLAVQQRLDDVQTQLEQLQGQQKVLDDQTALGALDVSVTEKAASVVVPPRHEPGAWTRAWDASGRRFAHGLQALVGASGPIALVLLGLLSLGLLGLAGRRVVRRLQLR